MGDNTSDDSAPSRTEKVQLNEWESRWLNAARRFIESARDIRRVLRMNKKSTDAESFLEILEKNLDRSTLANMTEEVDEIGRLLSQATFELLDAVALSATSSEERQLALALHRAKIEKIGDDFKLSKQAKRELNAYASVFFRKNLSEHHEYSVNSGLLAVLDASFEIFIRELMTAYLAQFDTPLNIQDLGFTYSDVVERSSISEFKDFAISRQVDRLVAGAMPKWIDWFSGRDKVLIQPEKLVMRELAEDFHLARNVLMHEGGVVTDRHAKLAKSDLKLVPGKKLNVSPKFMSIGLTAFLSFGLSIWAMATAKLFEGRSLEMVHLIAQQDLLREGFFAPVVNCRDLWVFGDTEWPGRTNLWFADSKLKKRRYAEEVEAWNPRDSRGSLAKALIRGEKSQALVLAQEMFDRGELTLADLYGWVFLEAIRDDIDVSRSPGADNDS